MLNILKGGDSSLRSENDDVDDFLSFGEKLERGRSPRSKMRHPEERKRRGISSFNGGGELTLSQLHLKNFKSLLGEVRRGPVNPFDLKEEMSHFVRHDDKWRRNESPPRTSPIKDLKSFLGLIGKGDFTPSQ